MDIHLLRLIADAMNAATGSNTCGIMHAEHFNNVLRSEGAVPPSWPVGHEPFDVDPWAEERRRYRQWALIRDAANKDGDPDAR